jgi:hypothetical protein
LWLAEDDLIGGIGGTEKISQILQGKSFQRLFPLPSFGGVGKRVGKFVVSSDYAGSTRQQDMCDERSGD